MNTELIQLVHYKNNKQNNPIGVVLATTVNDPIDGPMITVGWSCAHSKLDTFDKKKGILIARNRALNGFLDGSRWAVVPKTIRTAMESMTDRAKKYFKNLPVR